MSDEKDNVVEFKPNVKPRKAPEVLECSDCGGQHFYLHFDGKDHVGAIECRYCERFLPAYCWGSRSE
jgi:hypothetical protein